MHLDIDALFLSKFLQDVGVGGSNLLAIKPFHPIVILCLRNSERQAALRESQTLYHIGILATLYEFILAYDTDVSNAAGHTLRNIIIPHVKHLDRKIT